MPTVIEWLVGVNGFASVIRLVVEATGDGRVHRTLVEYFAELVRNQ